MPIYIEPHTLAHWIIMRAPLSFTTEIKFSERASWILGTGNWAAVRRYGNTNIGRYTLHSKRMGLRRCLIDECVCDQQQVVLGVLMADVGWRPEWRQLTDWLTTMTFRTTSSSITKSIHTTRADLTEVKQKPKTTTTTRRPHDFPSMRPPTAPTLYSIVLEWVIVRAPTEFMTALRGCGKISNIKQRALFPRHCCCWSFAANVVISGQQQQTKNIITSHINERSWWWVSGICWTTTPISERERETLNGRDDLSFYHSSDTKTDICFIGCRIQSA